MKLTGILKSERLSMSFEVFPPKTDSAFDSVKGAVREIAALRPAFMSVTYGAGGGTGQYTLDIAAEIKREHGVPTLAHLTCVSSTRATVHEKIEAIKAAGIENVMALRGDIPVDLLHADRSHWEYLHAIDLIRELKESNVDFCIGGACYPEIHPESINQKEDIKYLKEKVEPDKEVINRIVTHLSKKGLDIRAASVFCTDSIALEYTHLEEIKSFETELIEMETSAFYLMADLMEVPAIALLVVSDNSATGTALVGRTEEENEKYDRARKEILPRMMTEICKMK